MQKEKAGLLLFWLAVVWTIFWGILASIHLTEFHSQVLTFEELEETMWALNGATRRVWALSPAVAALIAGVGLLLHAGAKSSAIWKFGATIFVAVILTMAFGHMGHFGPLYAIGGTLIFSFFFGILWLWVKERKTLTGDKVAASDYRLIGYVFLLLGAWFTCGIVSPYWAKTLSNQPPITDPIIIIIYFVLGWMFLFLSHYKNHQAA